MLWQGNNIVDLQNQLKKMNEILSSQTACFLGLSPQKSPWQFDENDERCKKMKQQAKIKIEIAIRDGYKNFLCGMAMGFEIICAEIILELKQKYSNINLIGAIPCKNQCKKWEQRQQDRYFKILNSLDGIHYIYEINSGKNRVLECNKYMINNSSMILALFDESPSTTKRIIDYAIKKGLKIETIKP